MQEAERKNAETLREYQSLECQHHQLNSEKQALKQEIDEHVHTISQLKCNHQHYLDQMKAELEETHKKHINSYDIKLQEAKRELSAAQEISNNAKSEMVFCEKQITDLNLKCSQCEKTIEKTEKKNGQLLKQLEEVQRQSQSKVKELETQLTTKLKEKEEAFLIAQKSLTEVQQKLGEVNKELVVKKQCCQDLEFRLSSSEAHLGKLKKESADKEKDQNLTIRDLETREKEMEKIFEQLKQEARVSKEKEQLSKDSLDRSNLEHDKLKKKITELEKEMHSTEANCNEMQKVNADLEKRVGGLENEKRDLENKNQDTMRKHAKYEADIKEKDSIINSLQHQNNKLMDSTKDFEDKLHSIIENKTLVEQKAKEADFNCSKAIEEKERISAAFSKKERETEALSEKFADLSNKSQQIEKEFQEQVGHKLYFCKFFSFVSFDFSLKHLSCYTYCKCLMIYQKIHNNTSVYKVHGHSLAVLDIFYTLFVDLLLNNYIFFYMDVYYKWFSYIASFRFNSVVLPY